MDPELARYLNRNYWQKRSEDSTKTATTMPSAPSVTSAPQNTIGKIIEVRTFFPSLEKALSIDVKISVRQSVWPFSVSRGTNLHVGSLLDAINVINVGLCVMVVTH